MLHAIFNELFNTGLLPDLILIMTGIYIYLMIKNEKENQDE